MLETVNIECACRHCRAYAARIGLTLPLRAEVNIRMHAAICTSSAGIHAMVQKAYQPPFGRMDAMQAQMGPWPIAADCADCAPLKGELCRVVRC